MKPLLRRFLLLTLLAGLAPGLPAATDRFERTKTRIDALLAHRLQAYPLPASLANPFQLAAAADADLFTPSRPTAAKADDPLVGDAEVLAYYAATLKVSGQLQLNGRPHLIINQAPYKEGDLIRLHGKDDATYYLKVLHIGLNELTLGYHDATLTLTVKN